MTRASILLATVLVPTALWAQAPPAPPEDPALVQQRQDVERLFEAGRFQEVIAVAAAPDIQPAVVYMAAQSYLKSSATPTPQQLQQAAQTFQRLEAQPAGDPWHFIGMSGRQVVQNQLEPAIASARQAIALDPMFGPSHYQLGLALMRGQRWAEAAAAFEAAAMRRPGHAYTHYYAGLSYNRAGRTDQMAAHFDQFLKLAPEAPERTEVLSLMRTIRR